MYNISGILLTWGMKNKLKIYNVKMEETMNEIKTVGGESMKMERRNVRNDWN